MSNFSAIPAYSFVMATRPNYESNVPGPGAYDIDSSHMTGQASANKFKIRTGHSNQESPGIWQSNPSNQHFMNKGIKGFFFSTSYKPAKSGKEMVPGPGHYDHHLSQSRIMKKQIAAIIPKSRKNARMHSLRVDVPGPGHYAPEELANSAHKKTHAFRFTSASKPEGYLNSKTPGPGAYQTNVKSPETGIVFPKDLRYRLCSKVDVPGPGKYETSKALKENKHSYSFGKATLQKHNVSDSPGPGAYVVRETISKKGAVIPKNSRRQFGCEAIPGPGHYDLTTITWKNNFPKFGKEIVKKLNFENPNGPGQYKIKPSFPCVSSGNSQHQSLPKLRF